MHCCGPVAGSIRKKLFNTYVCPFSLIMFTSIIYNEKFWIIKIHCLNPSHWWRNYFRQIKSINSNRQTNYINGTKTVFLTSCNCRMKSINNMKIHLFPPSSLASKALFKRDNVLLVTSTMFYTHLWCFTGLHV